MNTSDESDAGRLNPAEHQLLAQEAARWVTLCTEDHNGSADPRALLAWLRRSARHVRAFLLAESHTIGLVTHADRSAHIRGRDADSVSDRQARFEEDIALLRPELGTTSNSDLDGLQAQVVSSQGGVSNSEAPRFLSQAVRDGKLSREQAQEVFDTQAKERRYEGRHRKAGQIAKERGYLTETDPDEIERARDRTHLSSDILRHPTERGGLRLAFAIQNLIALIVLLIAIGSHPGATRTTIGWLQVVAVGGLFGSLVISLLPRGAYRRIHHKAILSAMYLIRNSAVFAGPIAISALLVMAGWTSRELLSPVQAPLVALVLLATSAVGISAAFQAHVKDYFEWREDAFSRVEVRLLRYLKERSGDIAGLRKEVLETAARVLTQNPWMQLPRRFVQRFKGPANVSLWYLSPNPERRCFDITEMTTTGAPADVQKILATFRDTHHPPFLDDMDYVSALKDPGSDTAVDPDQRIHSGKPHVLASLAALVSARRQPQLHVNVREWISRDESHLRLSNISHLPKLSKAWLDYRTAVAYPVFSDRKQRAPASVLLAFANVPNGFTDADLAAIRRVTRLLGSLLPAQGTSATVHRRSRSRVHQRDRYRPTVSVSLEPPNIVTNFLWPLGQMVFGRHTLAG